MYAEALEAVESTNGEYAGKTQAIIDIGSKHIKSLFDRQLYADAASFCPKIFSNNRKLWEEHVKLFIDKNQIIVR